MNIEKYLNNLVSVDNYLGNLIHLEQTDIDEYVVVLDTLDGQFITISPCYESEIKLASTH